MKVKSKFLGLGAKLAAALLVFCGTVLTGCYSENDDVAIPYVESDPIYTITGVVLDGAGKPLQGVAISVSSGPSTRAVADITNTGADGLYSISSKNNKYGKREANTATPNKGENSVSFTYNGETVTFKVNLEEGASGGASIGTQNVVFIEGGSTLPELPSCSVAEVSSTKTATYTSAEDPKLDIVNMNDVEKTYSLNVILPEGSKFADGKSIEEAFAKVTPADIKEGLIAYAKVQIGDVKGITDMDYSYEFKLPARSFLDKLIVNSFMSTKTYTITYSGTSYVIEFTKYGTYTVVREYASWDHSHGHGHGHGHGEDYNAGGGIIEGLN